MSMKRILGTLVLTGSILPVQPSDAATYTWDGTSSFFDLSSHWTPLGGPPGALDAALFNSANTYSIFWDNVTGDRTNATWTVQNGHVTMLKSSGTTHTYTATGNAYINTNGWLTLGAPAQPLNLSIGGKLYIDTGTFEVRGGSATDAFAYIGNTAGSIGSATVNGAGSTWTNTSALLVGNFGTGTLNVLNGGAVSDNTALIGGGTGSVGTVTVDGAGSIWSNTAGINVGYGGNGTLTIRNGGSVNDASAIVGYGPLSTGAAIVDGVGSSWTNTTSLTVGSSGNGALTIQNGGAVSDDKGIIGTNAGATGTVTVDGVGSIWTNTTSLELGGTSTSGTGGTGILNIRNGGVVNSGTASIGRHAGAPGAPVNSATVDGAGSTWNNSALLIVGDSGDGELTARNGGTVNSGSALISGGTGSTATVTVDGAGANWSSTGAIDVGNGGHGTLNIRNGGAVSDATATIGLGPLSTGVATVDGTGSSWTNTGALTIGVNGTGTLNILNGGAVTSSGYLGANAGGSGTANIDGVGSHWTHTGIMLLGNFGTGTLNISNGGTVTTHGSNIGGSTAAIGAATVDGAGSTWSSTGAVTVGYGGNGTLTIQNGGAVNNASATVGWGPLSTGTATVDGAGATWTNNGALTVGNSGAGTLIVQNGGMVTDDFGVLGLNTGSAGTATVGGAGSTWDNATTLSVGGSATASGGNGTLTVGSGGLVTVGTILKLWSAGVLNLNGGTVKTADLAGTGTLNFNAGTLGVTNSLLLDSTSPLGTSVHLSGLKTLAVGGATTLSGYNTLSVDGGTFSTGSLVDNGGFAFNSGTFNLTNANLVVGSGGLFGPLAQFNYGQTINVTNTATVDAGAILGVNNGAFSAGTINNNGQIAMSGLVAELGGGTLNNAGLVTGNGQVTATLHNGPSGEVRAGSGEKLRFIGAGNVNGGRITLQDGTAEFTQDLTNTASGFIAGRGTLYASGGLSNAGTVALSAGTSDIHGNVNNTGTVVVTGNSTATFYNSVVHNGSEIRVTNGSSVVFLGQVSGAGPYTGTGSVFFEGLLTPGNSPALVNVAGDMTLGITSQTIMELGGLTRGTQYDAFDVAGTLFLGGELDVVPFDLGGGLFTPSLGDSFDLFHADVVSGSFDQLLLASLGNGLSWQLDILPDAIGLTDVVRLSVIPSAVPVPPAIWLFGSGLLGLMAVARRRQGG